MPSGSHSEPSGTPALFASRVMDRRWLKMCSETGLSLKHRSCRTSTGNQAPMPPHSASSASTRLVWRLSRPSRALSCSIVAGIFETLDCYVSISNLAELGLQISHCKRPLVGEISRYRLLGERIEVGSTGGLVRKKKEGRDQRGFRRSLGPTQIKQVSGKSEQRAEGKEEEASKGTSECFEGS